MQCYTELAPPTAVTHAVALPFLHPTANNLVVAKTSLLQVFTVTRPAAENASEKLVLVGEYSLAGTVTAIARVKTIDTKTGADALLLAFKDAKLSLVEWDQENHRLSTISIHYYEGENVITQPFGPTLSECDSILTIDPNSRCAALKFGARQLAVLPFRQSGEDLGAEEEDGFDAEPTSPTIKRRESTQQNENGETVETPYMASFVVPLTTLDPSLSHTVHLAFLHEYREATLGILSSQVEPSTTLLDERKDILTYSIFTLDLEQRASTNMFTVGKLPSSLWKVVPLPLPIGGALLVGTNELIHIDQSGKANATAVNEFAKLESDFGMLDQSHLNLKLEDCAVEVLDSKTGELLIVLRDGLLATVYFQKMGRSISALKVSRVVTENGGDVVKAAPSCITKTSNGSLFIGSEDGVSSLVGWTRPTASLSRKRSHARMLGQEGDEDDEDAIEEEDDDLYDAEPETKKRALSTGTGTADTVASFHVRDVLPTIAPINDICLGKAQDSTEDKLQLLLGSGRERSSMLTGLNRDIVPESVHKSSLQGAKRAWTVHAVDPKSTDEQSEFDNLLFVYDGEDTKVYDITHGESDEPGYVERSTPEFEHEGETIDMRTLANDSIVVQCRRTEIRTYDSNLALSQIIPMMDDETDAEFNIVHLSFCDPYLLVIRDDSSVQVLSVQGKEIEPLEGEGPVLEKKWLSGCVYSGSFTADNPTLFLLDANGSMQVFSLPDLSSIYSPPSLAQLPPVLSLDGAQRRAGTKEAIAELLVADLGQYDSTQPYLVLRTAVDDVILYEPFHYPPPIKADSWQSNLRFRKVPLSYIPKYNDTLAEEESGRSPALTAIRVGSYLAVTIPAAPPLLLLKEPSSLPRILEVRLPKATNKVTSLEPVHRSGCERGFTFVTTNGELQECQLARDTWYGTGWSVQQMDFGGREVRHLAYHETRGVYVVATCEDVDFYFASEDHRHPEQDEISLRPKVPQYSVHLVSSKTHRILSTVDMPYLETITALKVMPLEVSENTHEQELRVVVATAAQRGEDMPAKGTVMVFDIIDVVPEPGVPESDFKMHLVAREEARGAITALAAFPGGFIGTAQGQKILVRGIKEDGSCLPVAFLDAQCHTDTIKTLGGTGMWLTGDAWKGLWFGGFTEEPYKITVLGKSPKTHMEVVSADFLPFDGSLFLLIMDANTDLHVLQYDPENPKTVNGLRLLHRSTFHVGHFPTSMTLLPSTLAPFEQQEQPLTNGTGDEEEPASTQLYHVLTTSLSGSIGLVTPLDEAAYRRLSALQTHLTSVLEHAAGLNPRAYRSIESESFAGAKGVVDGGIVRRIGELGALRRADVLARAGTDAWGLRSDLEIIGGGGLGYL
ncbi:hypothetical protein PRZ48_009571 [Zasmidium cellare]|uniref:Uncharacterized protein n=1 Tax=Zasmidium cellare TaxID=395010 RepID=A0ABR0EC37_ZASCE|nr:hypothetical protein PRZ48_009571 [Zasmidium cellare]